MGEKKHRQLSVEKWQKRQMEVRSKYGEMETSRSFLYIDECVEGVRRLVESDFREPVNIGSEEVDH